jgi:phenylacetic acid degradation operon negative regulatory protein
MTTSGINKSGPRSAPDPFTPEISGKNIPHNRDNRGDGRPFSCRDASLFWRALGRPWKHWLQFSQFRVVAIPAPITNRIEHWSDRAATTLRTARHFSVAIFHRNIIVARMETKTQELLYMLLWTCDSLSDPWRNLTESFEAWAYRKGLLRQLQRLEKQQFIQRSSGESADRLFRLTEAGRIQAVGPRDPERCWKRRWDGRWRVILFDVPETRRADRGRLRQHLCTRGFGCLQGSVWISPHPVKEERILLKSGEVNVNSLILLECRPCAGETDLQIVTGAWDFGGINSRYARYQEVLAQCPDLDFEEESARAFHQWFQEERLAWMNAVDCDPLLPDCLWPDVYAGRQAWERRLQVMQAAAQQMRKFRA